MDVWNIIGKNLWIIKEDGLCLVHYNLKENSEIKYDESIVGAFTSALVNSILSAGLTEFGLFSISFEQRHLYYYYEGQLIICMETEKSVNKRMVLLATEKIHKDFSLNYREILKSNKLLNPDHFISFKKKILSTLTNTNLLSSKYNFKILLANLLVRIQGL